LQVVKSFPYTNLKALSSRTYKIKWFEILSNKKSYSIQGTIAQKNSSLPSSSDVTSRIKKALEHRFINKSLDPPPYESKEANITLHAHLDFNKVTLSLNTSGRALHKRGYRFATHEAPLKETLASSLLDIIGYKGQAPLCDPMSGSGTIPIEACYLALQKAVHIHRKKNEFSLEYLLDFDSTLFRSIQERLRNIKTEQTQHPIYCWDIKKEHIELSKNHALKARVEKFLTFECCSFFDKKAPHEHGYLIANLPYGKRLDPQEDLQEFYQKIGTHLKHNFHGWTIGLLVAEDTPWKKIGLSPTKKISLLNGSVKTRFLVFEIYPGSKKQAKKKSDSLLS